MHLRKWQGKMFESSTNEGIPFVIAEVGQNHQGELDLARQFVDVFASAGADAIKFQTRNNRYLFADDAYFAQYQGEHTFGPTYGAHREALELKPEWLPILRQDCKDRGVCFMSTPFDEPSLELLIEVGVDILKIASFDLGNLPFANRIGAVGLPTVLSTGGGDVVQIRATVDVLADHNIEVALLHCVSEYPCDYRRLGLGQIRVLKELFPECCIGSSDHFNGTLSGPVAYLEGARVFEKHVTLDRSWKGTDQSFSLEREGFRRFVRDVHRVRHMLPPKDQKDVGNEPVFNKLGKSLVARRSIVAGQVIQIDDLSGKIFKTQYIPVRESNEVIGRVARRSVEIGLPILPEDLW